jgi:hypothetical protein
MLRHLLDLYDPELIRRTGERVLGFPPDVFGVTYTEYRQLWSALNMTADSKPVEGKAFR